MKGCEFILSTGEKLNYNQMREHLLKNYPQLLQNNGTLFPPTQPTEPSQKPKDEGRIAESGKKARKTYETLINRSSELTEQQKELAKKDPNRYYTPISSQESQDIAAKIVEELGVDNAAELATSNDESIPEVVKVAILGEATSRYAAEGKTSSEVNAHDKFLENLERLAVKGTNLGRAIAQLKKVYQLSGLGVVAKMQKALDEKASGQLTEEEINKRVQEVRAALEKEFGGLKIDFEKKIEKEKDEEIKSTIEKINSQRTQTLNKAINLVRNLRSQNKSKLYDATLGIPVAIFDAGLAMLEYSLMAGLKVSVAIDNAVDKMKELLAKEGKTFDEAKFRKFIKDNLGDDLLKQLEEEQSPVSTKPKKDMVKKAKEKIEQQSKKIKIGNIELSSTSVHKLLKNILKGEQKGIDEAIKEGLGFKLSEEDSKLAIEIADYLKNPNTPNYIRSQYEEILQYLIKKNGINLKYFVIRDGMVGSQLSGLWNFIQNLTGFTIAFSRLFITAIRTRNVNAFDVFFRELALARSEAMTIGSGRVSRGIAYKDLIESKTSGEIGVRFLEYYKSKNLLTKLFLSQRYITRFLEFADTFASAASSGLSDYTKISMYLDKYYPELTGKERAKMEYEIMYGETTRDDIKKAITDLKASGVPNPTKAEINRTIYERKVRARDRKAKELYDKFIEQKIKDVEDYADAFGITLDEKNTKDYARVLAGDFDNVVAQGQEQAQIDTGKLGTIGIASIIQIPMEFFQAGLSKQIQEKGKYRKAAMVGELIMTRGLFPFATSIARWTELGLELTPYGAAKGIGYKISATTKKDKKEAQKTSQMGTDFMLRSMLGALYIIPYFLLRDDDEEEKEDALVGFKKREKYAEEKVAAAGAPKQSLRISENRRLPLQLLGTVSTAYMWYAEVIREYKNLIEKNKGVPEEARENIAKNIVFSSALMTLEIAAESSWMKSAQAYGGIAEDFAKGEVSKSVENAMGRIMGSTIPFNRLQQDIGQLLNPKSKEQEQFAINVVNQFSIVRALTPGKPNFDYRGREYDTGDIWVNSIDGARKFIFGAPKYRDEIDVWLTKMNYAVSSSYRQTRAEDKGNLVMLEPELRTLDDDEWYDFRKKSSELFNNKLKDFYKSKEWQGYNPEEQRAAVSLLLNMAKSETIAAKNGYWNFQEFKQDVKKRRDETKEAAQQKDFKSLIENIKLNYKD